VIPVSYPQNPLSRIPGRNGKQNIRAGKNSPRPVGDFAVPANGLPRRTGTPVLKHKFHLTEGESFKTPKGHRQSGSHPPVRRSLQAGPEPRRGGDRQSGKIQQKQFRPAHPVGNAGQFFARFRTGRAIA